MNVLVIGSGGREHALIWKIKQSDLCDKIYCATGNAGISKIAQNVKLNAANHNEIVDFCSENNIGLVVVGPEAPLVDGLCDTLEANNILTFGSRKAASQLEGSKDFTKKLCDKYNIPTASYETFDDAAKAKAYIKKNNLPIVVKADGLAAGKGVIIAFEKQEAFDAIDTILTEKTFGDAGNLVVVEEFLDGEELSVFAICDGENAVYFGSAQDHKQVGEGDTGPNTGGMGTYSPAPIMNDDLQQKIMKQIINPSMAGMKQDGNAFKGVLFAGLMVKDNEPKLLEFNVRFGDPETQVLMTRLDSDIMPILLAAAKGEISEDIDIQMKKEAALCVVMAAMGYPSTYKKGSEIKNLEIFDYNKEIVVFHAGTKFSDNGEKILANGGRVLGVTATGSDIKQAQENAYKAVKQIDWQDGFYRSDIGWKALRD